MVEPYRGYSFPIKLRKAGYFTPFVGTDTIKASILQILGTRPGERVHNPEFGSRLFELVFNQNDDILEDIARDIVSDALRRWEPRIDLIDVGVNRFPDQYVVQILVQFILRDETGEPATANLSLQLSQSGVPLGLTLIQP